LILAASFGNFLVWVVWILAAGACIASAVGVVTFKNPFFSALALIGNLGSLAVLYLLVSAEFVAAAQVLVYAGAVMVMFLFVIAYIGPRRRRRGEAARRGRARRRWSRPARSSSRSWSSSRSRPAASSRTPTT
jgi:NADH:ubiquinone oxidoreductase subunit 6 (subunit J)